MVVLLKIKHLIEKYDLKHSKIDISDRSRDLFKNKL